MDEILEGVYHWSAEHPNTGKESSCHWVPALGSVFDPLLGPDTGIEAFADDPPTDVVLSCRHHLRDSERFAREYGSVIRCSVPGLHEFDGGGPEVAGYEFGSQPVPGVTAIEIDAISPDETALLLADQRALLVADGVRHEDGDLEFFPDRLLGDDPEGVKRGLREAYARVVRDESFDHLLFAHGEPIIGDGAERLAAFAEAG